MTYIYKSIITLYLILSGFIGLSFAQTTDLQVQSIQINNIATIGWVTGVIQNTIPRIHITIENLWPDELNFNDTETWFIVCNNDGLVVFNSSYIWNIYIAAWWFRTRNNLLLDPSLTENLTEQTVTCVVNANQAGSTDPDTNNNELSISFNVLEAPTGRFDLTMGRAIQSIEQNLDPAEAALGTQWVVNFVRSTIINLLIPIIIIIGVIVAIIGFYKMMFSDSEEWTKEWSKYLIRGVVGIIIMMSSRYLANTVLFENILWWWNLQTFNGIQVAQTLYNQAVFPFIKIAMYLAMGVLFVIIVTRVLQYLTNPSDEVKKQAATLIAWNVIGILIILWSKQIVELIFWSETEVMEQSAQDLGDIWTWILSGNLPILYTIINWVMGLAAFVILLIIVIQTYQLLVNPTNEETIGKIKKSFLYIAAGILVIGAGYVITNFLIIN